MKNEKYFKEGTYVVALKNTVAGIFGFNKGDIAKIINSNSIEYQSIKWAFTSGSKYEENGTIRWFETLEEAQAFSKSLFPVE
jgi:archaellum component FlaG (FlaF/FlaG flagellin family)